jgi:hypothetical protein
MPDELKAAALVLSDLHFGADLLREAEIPPLWLPWWKNIFAPGVRHYMETRCKSHDLAVLMSLPHYLKKLMRQMRREGYEEQDFGLYLILGDLSTFSNGASYNFLREYLTEGSVCAGGQKLKGLRIPLSKLVVIPGNHDKMLRKDIEIFRREFVARLGLFPGPRPRGSSLLSKATGDIEFLFIMVEASIYASDEVKLDLSARKHLASGEISERLKAEIKDKLNKLRNGETVDGAALKNYARALKVLLVHYAVDDHAVLGVVPHPEEIALPHGCEGLSELVGELKPDLDLVIHGHLHRPKVYNHEGVQVISATTTTQKGGYNGFFLVKFFKSGDVRAEHHKWRENGFSVDDDSDLNVRILSLPNVRAGAGSAGTLRP